LVPGTWLLPHHLEITPVPEDESFHPAVATIQSIAQIHNDKPTTNPTEPINTTLHVPTDDRTVGKASLNKALAQMITDKESKTLWG